MVKVEIKGTEGPLYCPFCGLELVSSTGFEPPCDHVLYMCVEDGGVEYCSPDLDEEELQKKIVEDGMDRATDDILGKKEAIKFFLFDPAPMSNFAVYVAVRTDSLQKK